MSRLVVVSNRVSVPDRQGPGCAGGTRGRHARGPPKRNLRGVVRLERRRQRAPRPRRLPRGGRLHHRDHRSHPGRLRRVLQRLRQPVPVAPVPQPDGPYRLRPALRPGLLPGQRALRARDGAPHAAGRPHLGPRLPPHRVRRGAAADGLFAPDGVLPAHPVPAGGPAGDPLEPRGPRARAIRLRPRRVPDGGGPPGVPGLRGQRGGRRAARGREPRGLRPDHPGRRLSHRSRPRRVPGARGRRGRRRARSGGCIAASRGGK